MSQFDWTLIVSLAMAFFAFRAGWITIGGHGPSLRHNKYNALVLRSYVLTIAWLVTLVIALCIFRWRGLWLLIGAPLALFWPAVFVAFAFAMARAGRANAGRSDSWRHWP
jgi:hypothetical protein